VNAHRDINVRIDDDAVSSNTLRLGSKIWRIGWFGR